MSKKLKLDVLPAREGDALTIGWGENGSEFLMIVDMGTEAVGGKFYEELANATPEEQKYELLVITHVDRDHIGGVLTCFAESTILPDLEIKDIWFNGWQHLDPQEQPDPATPTLVEPYGPVQGERLTKWLRDQPWNEAFGKKQVSYKPGEVLETRELAGGLKVTILGPLPKRLRDFKGEWKEKVKEALEKGKLSDVSPGLESYGARQAPTLRNASDLTQLADTESDLDDSHANGSSIVLLLEYGQSKVILAGDAYAPDLVEAIQDFSPHSRLSIDAFKLPHHGSKKNVTTDLIKSVSCQNWIISTDGTRFRHPDNESIAKIIKYSDPTPKIHFNVRSRSNKWWDSEDWQQKFSYETRFGDADDGLYLEFPK